MKRFRLNRRTFLRGSAGTIISLPFLEAMLPSGAYGAEVPKRFIAWVQPLGTFGEMFWPAPPGQENYSMYPTTATCMGIQKNKDRCRLKVGRTGDTFMENRAWTPSRILQPLARHRDDLLVIENLNNTGNGHAGYSTVLTAGGVSESGGKKGADSISIDQVIASKYGDQTRFPSLQFGVYSADRPSDRTTVSWYGKNKAAVSNSDPRSMFQRIFAGFGVDPELLKERQRRRQSILDAALAQTKRLETKLGAQDRQKLEQYTTAIREVERRLGTLPGGNMCQVPKEPAEAIKADKGYKDVPEVTLAQIELMTLAMACDLTRVSTFQFSMEANNMVATWLGNTRRWHDLSHTGASGQGWQKDMEEYVRLSEFNASQIAIVLDKLKEFGLFGHTALLWINPMNNAQIHNNRSIPIVVAGSAGGALKQGTHIRFPKETHTIADLHPVLLESMGVKVDSFGDQKKFKRPLTELLTKP